jgi:hypothetical protein
MTRLSDLAAELKADYGRIAGGGEILQWTEKRRRGDIAVDAVGRGLDKLLGRKIPSGAFYSARVNLAPNPDDAANYKTIGGIHYVPTAPYTNPVGYSDGLMRLADNVENKQEVLSITFRIGIPPKGFMAVHGDGLLRGPRVEIKKGRVFEERPKPSLYDELSALMSGQAPKDWA